MIMKKISLYLGQDLFYKIDKLRAIYLLEGPGVSEAPEISELIEAIISWYSYYLYTDPEEKKIIHQFLNNDKIYFGDDKKSKLTGRVFFPLSTDTEEELEKIRKKIGTKESDGILIRDMVKRMFDYDPKSDSLSEFAIFVSRTYLEYLYGLSLRSCFFTSLASRNLISIKELQNEIDEEEFKIVREILLDQGKISKLKEDLKFLPPTTTKVKGKIINEDKRSVLGLNLDIYYKYINLLNSSSYYFNYYDAYLGYLLVFNFWAYRDLTHIVPDFLQCFLWYKEYQFYTKPIEWFFEELDNLLDLSRKINEEVIY